MTFAVVTGGGTSGHYLPAMAIAEALVAGGHPADDIHYVGTQRGIEARLAPISGHPYTLLDVVGLQRSLSTKNLALPATLRRSVKEAVALLQQLQPKVVVNVGGYGSFPATWAARKLGIPYVVVSYDKRPGLVSKLLAPKAAAVAAAFEGSPLPGARLTGAPLRQAILQVDRAAQRDAARVALDLPSDRFVVAVMTGSLGAGVVNAAVAALVEQWADRTDLAVHHVVGDRFLDQAAPARDGAAGILYRVIGYEDRMPEVYAAADLLVTRAGSSTIAELACTGTPGIVIPWPDAAENHQLGNAQVLSDVGAAVLLEQRDLTVERLGAEIDGLRANPARLAAIAERAAEAGQTHRSGALAALVEEVAAR
ncbi:MAG: UDP-N-acetylglucosamine--N-acetylmuramyl-(pentapeptide) pyrophosphoryl-undecaprenol N-acetylglucosamine transferase [Ilumatobacteraceae bacterium]